MNNVTKEDREKYLAEFLENVKDYKDNDWKLILRLSKGIGQVPREESWLVFNGSLLSLLELHSFFLEDNEDAKEFMKSRKDIRILSNNFTSVI